MNFRPCIFKKFECLFVDSTAPQNVDLSCLYLFIRIFLKSFIDSAFGAPLSYRDSSIGGLRSSSYEHVSVN